MQKLQTLLFPSLKRRGGCTERSEVQTGWSVRRKHFSRAGHPGGLFIEASPYRARPSGRHPSFSRRGKIQIVSLAAILSFSTVLSYAQATTAKSASPSDF